MESSIATPRESTGVFRDVEQRMNVMALNGSTKHVLKIGKWKQFTTCSDEIKTLFVHESEDPRGILMNDTIMQVENYKTAIESDMLFSLYCPYTEKFAKINSNNETVSMLFIEYNYSRSSSEIISPVSQITDYIFISGYTPAYNPYALESHGITRVFSAMHLIPNRFRGKSIKYKGVEIEDDRKVKINLHFEEAYKFIEDSVNEKQKCLVHCMAGISRSVTMVAMYLIIKYNVDRCEAMNMIKNGYPKNTYIGRRQANPNVGFALQLEQLVTARALFRGSKIYDCINALTRIGNFLWEEKPMEEKPLLIA